MVPFAVIEKSTPLPGSSTPSFTPQVALASCVGSTASTIYSLGTSEHAIRLNGSASLIPCSAQGF